MRRAVSASLLLIVLASCRSGPKIDYKGKTLYTRVNIWYNELRRDEISSANYHSGKILPVGTAVQVLAMKSGSIRIQSNKTGEHFVLQHDERDVGGSVLEYYYRMLHEVQPKIEGRFSKEECRAIWLGVVEPGMSKEAVLVAWGYPPAHQTMSLKNDAWVYWMDRTATKTVKFSGGKVESIE